MKLLRYLVLFMLAHHEPGVCAPAVYEEPKVDPEQVNRIRQALLAEAKTLTAHEVNTRQLRSAPLRRSLSTSWAAREAIEAVRPTFDLFPDKNDIYSLEES